MLCSSEHFTRSFTRNTKLARNRKDRNIVFQDGQNQLNIRCCAGNSIVQFARTPADNRIWAIKCFLSPTAFENESVLYAAHYPELRSQLPIAAADRAAALKRSVQNVSPVRRAGAGASAKFLPRVELSVGLHGGLMDPKGMPLPPCVVMERGESLLEWWSHVDQSRHAAQRVRLLLLLPSSTGELRVARKCRRTCIHGGLDASSVHL
jgi:hypothetical protein